jgi:predicted transposase YbfD/YdcC
MVDYTQHTIYLQDGSLFNFKRRFKRSQESLFSILKDVVDGRSKFGKRHPLPVILIILFSGIIAGNTTIKDCRLWGLHNKKWLEKHMELPHGLLDARTISRAIAKIDMNSLVHAFLKLRAVIYGYAPDGVGSFDGKTLNGAHGKDVVKHMLSLFTHQSHQIIGQIGVTQKENEIPAFHRLLKQIPSVAGMLLVGDALHTQTDTCDAILSHYADYLLFAKDNQEQLVVDLETFFMHLPFKSIVETTEVYENKRKRDITTTVTISHDTQMCAYLGGNWKEVKTIGKIHRSGIRITSDGKETAIHETVYCISSRELTAGEVAEHTKNHWQIENNLHWEKDWLFLEDRQTLRSGNSPQVMSYLRSMCLSLFALWEFYSPTEVVSNFEKNQTLHHTFLTLAGVVS